MSELKNYFAIFVSFVVESGRFSKLSNKPHISRNVGAPRDGRGVRKGENAGIIRVNGADLG